MGCHVFPCPSLADDAHANAAQIGICNDAVMFVVMVTDQLVGGIGMEETVEIWTGKQTSSLLGRREAGNKLKRKERMENSRSAFTPHQPHRDVGRCRF